MRLKKAPFFASTLSIERAHEYGDVTDVGVAFEYSLSVRGAHFILFREEDHTDEDIERAARELHDKRDVVEIMVADTRGSK